MSVLRPDYASRVADLGQELGIPSGYAKARGIAICPEATELVSIGPDDDGRDCLLAKPAAAQWRAMRAKAAEAGIELTPLSGFRSIERQAQIIRGKLALGEPVEQILRTMAAPGYSEHHSGCAVDIGTPDVPPLEEAFATTPAFKWLGENAANFGFHLSYPKNNRQGFIYEPWHWCWVPSAES